MRKAVVLSLSLSLFLFAVILAAVGCGGGSSDAPEKVAEEFIKASIDGDADAAYALISKDSTGLVENKEDLVAGMSEGISEYHVGGASIAGDTAKVATSLTLKDLDFEMKFDMILVKEGGSWKIDLAQTQTEMEKAVEEFMKDFEKSTTE